MNNNLLIVILKRSELISEICKNLTEAGVHGGTIVDGTGMASIIEKMDDLPIFGMLRSILADDDEDEDTVKVMMFVMSDDELVRSRKIVKEVVGLDKPNTGIMFAMPLSFVDGLGA